MAVLVFVLLLGLAAALAWLARRGAGLERRLSRAESDLRRLRAFQVEAAVLETARGRFRRRQRGVEQAVDSGTRSVEQAHRSLAGRFGWPAGADLYRRLRGVNRTIGRGVSGLFAPATASRRRESLRDWRAGRRDTSNHDED
ncbi:hypothetical protein [Salinisphaera hydrothermalis]|uniref:hypothetical protein n=1 Tax=Salinisphaera hydrothermalis TaxID=563188 RepID=UPI00334191DA